MICCKSSKWMVSQLWCFVSSNFDRYRKKIRWKVVPRSCPLSVQSCGNGSRFFLNQFYTFVQIQWLARALLELVFMWIICAHFHQEGLTPRHLLKIFSLHFCNFSRDQCFYLTVEIENRNSNHLTNHFILFYRPINLLFNFF